MSVEDEVLQEIGDRLLLEALSLLRMLTPEAWDKLYTRAVMDRTVHTSDASMIKVARLVAMRGGPKYGGGIEYTNPELAEQLARSRR